MDRAKSLKRLRVDIRKAVIVKGDLTDSALAVLIDLNGLDSELASDVWIANRLLDHFKGTFPIRIPRKVFHKEP